MVSQTKSRKIPTRNILPLFFVLQLWENMLAEASPDQAKLLRQNPPSAFDDLAAGASDPRAAPELSGELYECMEEHGLRHFQAWLASRGWNTKAKVVENLTTLSPDALTDLVGGYVQRSALI